MFNGLGVSHMIKHFLIGAAVTLFFVLTFRFWMMWFAHGGEAFLKLIGG